MLLGEGDEKVQPANGSSSHGLDAVFEAEVLESIALLDECVDGTALCVAELDLSCLGQSSHRRLDSDADEVASFMLQLRCLIDVVEDQRPVFLGQASLEEDLDLVGQMEHGVLEVTFSRAASEQVDDGRHVVQTYLQRPELKSRRRLRHGVDRREQNCLSDPRIRFAAQLQQNNAGERVQPVEVNTYTSAVAGVPPERRQAVPPFRCAQLRTTR